jgi:hypothetical protein
MTFPPFRVQIRRVQIRRAPTLPDAAINAAGITGVPAYTLW